jgi:tRNA-2-methylthio-N6-dimethylallyladenosine synthase
MNVHDSERLSGLLEDAGYVPAADEAQADVVVFNTCAVRENADNKLYGNLGHLAPIKAARPGMQIAVGGCLAQKDRGEITRKAPWVDVVFGTHNIGSLPVLLERARVQEEAQVEILESLEVFPSTLPTKRESAYAAWVSISVGCNNTCTFCIVPSLRGKEKDRRPGDILAEIRALVAEGVSEVTLLGQNVNTYGVRVRQAAACLRRDRGPGAGPVHQPPPGSVHRRRDRGDGADAERDAAAAHAAAVRVGQGAQGHAAVLSAEPVPRHHRAGPRRDAGGGDHDRHHRRLPR